MIRPFFPMFFLIAQQRSFWGILFGGWSEIKLVAQKAQVEMPQTSQVMGFNTEYGPKLCEGRMWALRAEGKSNIKWVKLEIFLIHYIWGIWMGLIIELILGYKKQLNWWDTPIDCGVPYLPDFQTRTYEKLEKKRGHCNGTHAPLIRQYLEMSNRCVWVCESAVCVNHLCVCVCVCPPPKKGIPQMHWFRRWSRKCKAWCWRQCWRVVNLFQGCSVFPLCPDFIHVYIYIYITVHYCTYIILCIYIYNYI